MFRWHILFSDGMVIERETFDTYDECFIDLCKWMKKMRKLEPDNTMVNCAIDEIIEGR